MEENNLKPLSLGVKDIDIAKEVRNSFLDYAMSVNVSRAIPDVRDGLKPVHRRIIYAMNELGMHYNKPYKKSARIVGDVIGKYHPHGDSSVYDALVRLAQDFSCRYTLIDGHGNFGSIDDDPAAAMRYTEARMDRLTMEMVLDLNKNTVDFGPNYDGEETEPLVLPARFPNLLVNGTIGIAVGMATSIPTHNMTEVLDALLAVIDNPEIDIIDLMNNYLPGPDFPTGGIILGRAGIKKAYTTGNGSLRIRSKHIIEEHEGRKRIIFTEIPYAISKVSLVKKIADLVKDKLIEGISDLRDESNRNGIRIIVELKKDCIPEVLLNHLYKLTPLQTTFSINMLALVKGQPKVLNLKEILSNYLAHQSEVIERRSRFDLNKTKEREHVVLGLKIALDNIDEIITIIRSSETTEIASNELITKFELSDKQAKVILEMQLRRLAGIERQKVEDELVELAKTILELEHLLNNPSEVLALIKNDLSDIRSRYGDARRSEISNEEFDIEDEDLIPVEDIVISLTNNGYVKRIALDTYRTQNRGGRGIKGVSTYDDDVVDKLMILSTHSDVLFFSNLGKVYRLRGYQVPEFGRNAKGIPIINLLKLDKNELIKSMISVKEYNDESTLLFVSVKGIVKRVAIKQFENIRQNGKIAFGLKDGDELFDVKLTDGHGEIIIASSGGKAVRINEEDIRKLGRTAVGVKSINVGNDKVVGAALSTEGSKILVISENGYGKCSELEDYRLTNRGAKGVKTLNATEKVGNLVAMRAVNGNEELLITTNKGIIIRVSLEQIRVAGRNTQGVRVIRLEENQKVASVTVIDCGDSSVSGEDCLPDSEEQVA